MQCPNCGGFKVYRPRDEEEMGCGSWLVLFLIAFVFPVGTFIFLWKLFSYNLSKLPSPDLYACRLCGYQWQQKPGEVLPIKVNPELIRRGEERLRQLEEEERRWQEAAWWWQQQQKK
jgi:hypothetical protein